MAKATGLDKALAMVEAVAKGLESGEFFAKAVDTWKVTAVSQAKAKVRKNTGELANSIQVEHKGPNRAELKATADHASFNEYGTTEIPANPALQSTAAQTAPLLAAHLDKEIKKVTK